MQLCWKSGCLANFKSALVVRKLIYPTRTDQSLLAYLVLNAGTAFRREHLAGLFWPNSDESNAKGYLRQALWRLRKAIHDAAPSAVEYIQANKIDIAFDSASPYWLDSATLADAGRFWAWKNCSLPRRSIRASCCLGSMKSGSCSSGSGFGRYSTKRWSACWSSCSLPGAGVTSSSKQSAGFLWEITPSRPTGG